MTPEQLIAKLERTVDRLRWLTWLEKNQGSILWVEGECSISAKDQHGDYFYVTGKTLREGFIALDAEINDRAVLRRRAQSFNRHFGRPESKAP